MKETVLILLKPECLSRAILGDVLARFLALRLTIVALKIVYVSRKLAEQHYKHLSKQTFFKKMIKHMRGQFHENNPLIAMVLCGDQAIRKCRRLAGATNPEEASPQSVRGLFGKITTHGIFENIVHVSESQSESKREIQLWFEPNEFFVNDFLPKSMLNKSHIKGFNL